MPARRAAAPAVLKRSAHIRQSSSDSFASSRQTRHDEILVAEELGGLEALLPVGRDDDLGRHVRRRRAQSFVVERRAHLFRRAAEILSTTRGARRPSSRSREPRRACAPGRPALRRGRRRARGRCGRGLSRVGATRREEHSRGPGADAADERASFHATTLRSAAAIQARGRRAWTPAFGLTLAYQSVSWAEAVVRGRRCSCPDTETVVRALILSQPLASILVAAVFAAPSTFPLKAVRRSR